MFHALDWNGSRALPEGKQEREVCVCGGGRQQLVGETEDGG